MQIYNIFLKRKAFCYVFLEGADFAVDFTFRSSIICIFVESKLKDYGR